MIIFQGQGAFHPQLGYCVIIKVYSRYKIIFKDREPVAVESLFGVEHFDVESVQPLGPKFVTVATANGVVDRVLISDLEPAEMPPLDLESLQKKIETYFVQRGSRTLVPIRLVPNQYTIQSRPLDYSSRSAIKLETDMNNGLVVTGGKCEHGVYIPAWYSWNDSPYCSNCRPYNIIAKKGEYKA